MAEGLFHPNCTHRMVAVPEVVAKEYYTPDGKEKVAQEVKQEKKEGNPLKKKNYKEKNGREEKKYYKGSPFIKLNIFKKKNETQIQPPSFEIKGLRGIAEQTKLLIGSDKVDFGKITDEKLLNQMNHALYKLKQKCPWLKIYGIKAVENLAVDNPAALTTWGELELNTQYINHLLETYSQYEIKKGKYINEFGAMYFEKEMETLVYHEAGHEIYRLKIGNTEKKNSSVTKKQRHKLAILKQMYRKAKREGYASSVSNYALKDEKEFFSEIFTANELDIDKIPTYIKDGIEEILK